MTDIAPDSTPHNEAAVTAEATHRRSAYMWNTAGSMLNAFQSVIMLMVITRVCDLATAGIFTIAYANANLFLNMGSFGMRNFEASDVRPQFGFRAYSRSRIITGTAMVVCSFAYLAWSAATVGYPTAKTAAIALMTLYKGVDTIEDVFDGNFQQQGRLDVGGRLLTFRVGSSILVFALVLVLTHDLVTTLVVGFAYTLAFAVLGLLLIRRRLSLPAWHPEAPSQSAWKLLRECLPLFIAAFLLFYIGNAPKYAIDAVMDDVAQAQYGFIAMPVFVVGLLSNFVYMPLVEPLSVAWGKHDVGRFVRIFLKLVGMVGLITLACVIAAYLLGVPVLGWLYNTDLSAFRTELCLLIVGGGFLALTSLFTMGITIMRRQRLLVWAYFFVAGFALVGSQPAVAAAGIAGASWLYLGCMAVLAAWFALVFVLCARKGGR